MANLTEWEQNFAQELVASKSIFVPDAQPEDFLLEVGEFDRSKGELLIEFWL